MNAKSENFVYCQNCVTFFSLIAKWNAQGRDSYQYTFRTTNGKEVSLEEILSRGKISVILGEVNREYIQ